MNTAVKTLGRDDFLKLFVNQLKYQNPLKPLESTEFTAQLAQFSSLEQLFNVNNGIQSLLAYQNSINNGMSVGFIGRIVKTTDGDAGTVMGVSFENGLTYLKLDSGKNITLSQVREYL